MYVEPEVFFSVVSAVCLMNFSIQKKPVLCAFWYYCTLQSSFYWIFAANSPDTTMC